MADPQLMRFLLVEDDDAHAAITIRSLRQNRMVNTIDRVSDGVEALRYLRAEGPYADRLRPDVVLLDLNLPRMDGHQVLKAVKEDPVLRTIPIVVLTTSNAEIDRLRAYHHHANSYLVKPIDFEQFRRLVQDLSLYWGIWNRPPSGQPGGGQNGEKA